MTYKINANISILPIRYEALIINRNNIGPETIIFLFLPTYIKNIYICGINRRGIKYHGAIFGQHENNGNVDQRGQSNGYRAVKDLLK